MRAFFQTFLILSPLLVYSQSFTKLNNATLNSKTGDLHGVYLIDFDNDYTLDIFVTTGNNGTNALFLNHGDSTFSNNSNNPVVSQTTVAGYSNWADMDNDCDLDSYWPTTSGPSYLYDNNGDGTFSRITATPLGADYIPAMAGPWADVNNDGLVDIVVASTLSGSNHLYLNDGNGSFTRIDTGAVANSTGGMWTASWGDLDNDGDPDLFLGNHSGNNYLLINNGGHLQLDSNSVISTEGIDTRSGAWGDYNNDGFLDLFVGRMQNSNFLYQNNGDGTFTKVTSGAIVNDVLRNGASSWADLDNDGDLDLYTTHTGNGLVHPNNNVIYRNNGNGTFSRTTSGSVYAETEGTIGCATSDLNNDGFLDIVNANRFNRSISVFLNDANANNFFKMRLYGNASNKMALGARIEVISAMGRQMRYINDESRRSQYFETHFGLGTDTIIDTLRIFWPAGGTCTMTDVPVNAFYNIGEGTCTLDSVPVAAFRDSSQYLRAFFTNKSKGAISSYEWGFGDGNTATGPNPQHTYSQPGVYEVTLKVNDNFCRHRIIKDSIEICPDTSTVGFTDNHLGLNLTLTDTSNSTGYDFQWDFGDGNSGSGAVASHTYASAGTYQVCLDITDSCRTKSYCRSITVCNDTLLAGFGATGSGLTINFSDSSVNAGSVSWDFGDGSTSSSANPVHTYPAPGYYLVCQTAHDICTSTTRCDTVEVCLDTVKADFSYSANGLVFNFSDQSTNAGSYLWDFGDGNFSTNQNPVHAFQAYGTYEVCLAVANDCYTDTICETLELCPSPGQAGFTFKNSVTPLSVQFTNTSVNAVSYYWDFGDGSFSTNKNPLKVFSDSAVYEVCLSITDSCGLTDTTCQTLNFISFGTEELLWVNSLKIYPNPAEDKIFIEGEGLQKSIGVVLYDVKGQKLMEKEFPEASGKMELHIGQLPRGLYVLSITTGSETRNVKISKK